jgi:hypothetical protein
MQAALALDRVPEPNPAPAMAPMRKSRGGGRKRDTIHFFSPDWAAFACCSDSIVFIQQRAFSFAAGCGKLGHGTKAA